MRRTDRAAASARTGARRTGSSRATSTTISNASGPTARSTAATPSGIDAAARRFRRRTRSPSAARRRALDASSTIAPGRRPAADPRGARAARLRAALARRCRAPPGATVEIVRRGLPYRVPLDPRDARPLDRASRDDGGPLSARSAGTGRRRATIARWSSSSNCRPPGDRSASGTVRAIRLESLIGKASPCDRSASRRGGRQEAAMPRRFFTLDVFTDRALAGNPLAVVLDAEGSTTPAMQAIARRVQPVRDRVRAAAGRPAPARRAAHLHARPRAALRRASDGRDGGAAGAAGPRRRDTACGRLRAGGDRRRSWPAWSRSRARAAGQAPLHAAAPAGDRGEGRVRREMPPGRSGSIRSDIGFDRARARAVLSAGVAFDFRPGREPRRHRAGAARTRRRCAKAFGGEHPAVFVYTRQTSDARPSFPRPHVRARPGHRRGSRDGLRRRGVRRRADALRAARRRRAHPHHRAGLRDGPPERDHAAARHRERARWPRPTSAAAPSW